MADILTFRQRPRAPDPASPVSPTRAEIRVQLEHAAQVSLDAADRIIAVLDHMDGDADLEDGAETEPSLAAPENHAGSQVVWMRGGDQDRESEPPEEVLLEVAQEDRPEAAVLPWRGSGNVVAAAGVALLDLVGR